MKTDRRDFLRGCLVALGFAVAPTALVGAPKRDRWIEIDLSDRPLPETDMNAYVAELQAEIARGLEAKFRGQRLVSEEEVKAQMIEVYQGMAEALSYEIPKIDVEFDRDLGILNARMDVRLIHWAGQEHA